MGDGTAEEDPNAENREILRRALKEEQLRDLKYKAEKKAEEMGILWYDKYSTAEEYAARSKRDRELEASNENYTGARLPDRVRRKSSSDEEDTNEQPKHPWDFNIDASRQKLAAEQNAEAEDENPVFNLLDEKERKRLLEKKLEKQMKKIQKQLEKEKIRVEERKREKAEAKAKRKLEREEAAKNLGGEKKIKVEEIIQGQNGEVKKKLKTNQKAMMMKTWTVSQWRTAKIKLPKQPSSGIRQFLVVYLSQNSEIQSNLP